MKHTVRDSEPAHMALRHQKLAERPKCAAIWDVNEEHTHVCRKIPGHFGRDHKCHCGNTMRRR